MNEVVVVIGAGSIGQAIARRVSAGKHVVLADLRQSNADAAAEVLSSAGFEVTAATGDVAMAIENPEAGRWAVQFHPESILTAAGRTGHQVIANVLNLCREYIATPSSRL